MLSEYIIHTTNGDITVLIVRSNRKNTCIEIRNGAVKARVPNRLRDKELRLLLEESSIWIERKLEELEIRKNVQREEEFDIKSLRQLNASQIADMKALFSERVKYYAEIMGVTYGRITIRNQKTRWGSCSGKGNLNFNYQLFFLPRELLDYVIVHELAHRRYMNHSKEFWAEVEKYYPDYKNCRKKLKCICPKEEE